MLPKLGALLSLAACGAVALSQVTYYEPSESRILKDSNENIIIDDNFRSLEVIYGALGLLKEHRQAASQYGRQQGDAAIGVLSEPVVDQERSFPEVGAKGAALFTISGVPQDLDAQVKEQLQHGRRSVQVDVLGLKGEELLGEVTKAGAIGAATEPDITLLGSVYPMGCTGVCQAKAMEHLATAMGCTYTPGKEDLSGTFSKDEQPVLSLRSPGLRLWALELAATNYHALRLVVQRENGSPLPSKPRHVLEATLVGLQAVRDEFGDGSATTKAATLATASVLDSIMAALTKVFDDQIVFQVALLDSLPVSKSAQWQELLPYRSVARRSLLEDAEEAHPGEDAEEKTQGESKPKTKTSEPVLKFGILTSNYFTFVVLVYFMMGSLYCIHSMKFKQDTLLYSREKLD